MPTERESPVEDADTATGDLEYDLVHEADLHAVGRPPSPPPVYVPNQTAAYDGDYGYDLAHDVPGR
ncbi:MAG TPA: hypothetical protein VF423_08640 [Actinomycetes bacterium]